MKHQVLPLLLLAAAAFGSTTMYSVEPIDMAHSAFVQQASQNIVAVADSVADAPVFIGAAQDAGYWIVTIRDERGQEVGQKAETCASCTAYSFVHFTFTPPLGVRKGTNLTLTINHSGWHDPTPVLTNVFWNPNNPYPNGGMTLTGIEMHPPPQRQPDANCDLACRINGQNRATDSVLFQACGGMMPWDWGTVRYPEIIGYMVSLGIRYDAIGIGWADMQPHGPDSWKDSAFQRVDAALDDRQTRGIETGILLSGSAWFSTACETTDTSRHGDTTYHRGARPSRFDSDHSWVYCYPPINLFEPVLLSETLGHRSVNPQNFYARLLDTLARHFSNRVHSWEIGVEPNGRGWKGFFRYPERGYSPPFALGNPDDTTRYMALLYARMTVIADSVFRRTDPDCRIVTNHLGGVWIEGANPLDSGYYNASGIRWLYDFAAEGGNPGNVIGVDPYQYFQRSFRLDTFQIEVDSLRQVIGNLGWGDRELWATEIGWPGEPCGSSQNTLELWKARSLLEWYVSCFAAPGSVHKTYDRARWYRFENHVYDTAATADRYGIFEYVVGDTETVRPKPAGRVFLQLVNALRNNSFDQRSLYGDTLLSSACQFQNRATGKRFWIAWQDGWQPGNAEVIRLPVMTESVEVVSTQLGVNLEPPPKEHHRAGPDGWFTMHVDSIPRYVYEDSALPPSRPDLAVDSVWTVPDTLHVGDWVVYRATVTNRGTAPTPPPGALPSYGIPIVFYLNGDSVAWDLCQCVIPPDSSVTLGPFDLLRAPNAGTRLLKAAVNPYQDFVELSRDNNAAYRSCVIRYPQHSEIVLNPGSPPGPSGVTLTNVPLVVLAVRVCDPDSGWADSMHVAVEHYSSALDTLPITDDFGWTGYDSLSVRTLTRGTGYYRFSVRGMLATENGRDTNVVLVDSCLYDDRASYGSFAVNRGAAFCATQICTLSTAVTDSGQAGLFQMRFAPKTFANVVADPFFDRDDGVWQGNHYTRDSIGVATLQLAQDTLVWFSQGIPAETLTAYFSSMAHIRLSADVVTQDLRSAGNMEFRWLIAKSDKKTPGPDTQFSSACCTAIPQHYNALAGDNSLRTWFDYNPPLPPPGYCSAGGKIWFSFPNPPAGSGFVYLDDIRLEPDSGSGYENAQWASFDTLKLFDLGSTPGRKTVYGQFKDRAGNETEIRPCERPYSCIAAQRITLDNAAPTASIGWPLDGQVINCLDTVPLDIIGTAFDLPITNPSLWHFYYYKLTWRRSDWGEDSTYGTEPDSLSYLPAPPVPPESMGGSGPYRHLAYWDAKSVFDAWGGAWYKLKLQAFDSAGNNCQAVANVKLLCDSNQLRCNFGGSTDNATSLTTTAEDNLYVGTSTGKVVEYSSTLDSTRALSLTDSSGPPIISGVTTDSTGAIFVSDIRARDLKCYDDSGVLEQTIGNRNQLASPDDIAVAANGDLYTIDRSNCVVRIYDINGSLKRSFGSRGSDTACFDQPAGIALNHPHGIPGDTTGTYNTPPMIFIADKGNHRVQTFDTTGRFISIIGAGLLQLPCAVALDSSNDVFVSDIGNQAIYAFSPSGRHYLTITSTDTLTPIAAALSNDNGFIYAIDSKHNTLAQYIVLYTDSTAFGGAQSARTNPIAPKEVTLGQSYPNPTTGRLCIRYGVPRTMKVSLKVYDISGKLVRTLVNSQTMKPGFYSLQWNCADQRNRQVACGIYFYRLAASTAKGTANSQPTIRTRKLVVAR